MSTPLETLKWLDDPVTVNPNDYLKRMAAADTKPGAPLKRARERLRYALEQRHILPAESPPFPAGHVYTDVFFRWLVRKYPDIEGIHPHYGRKQLSVGCVVRWKEDALPSNPPDPMTALRQENERLKAHIETLQQQLDEVCAKIHRWEERDREFRRKCGRRLTEKR